MLAVERATPMISARAEEKAQGDKYGGRLQLAIDVVSGRGEKKGCGVGSWVGQGKVAECWWGFGWQLGTGLSEFQWGSRLTAGK